MRRSELTEDRKSESQASRCAVSMPAVIREEHALALLFGNPAPSSETVDQAVSGPPRAATSMAPAP